MTLLCLYQQQSRMQHLTNFYVVTKFLYSFAQPNVSKLHGFRWNSMYIVPSPYDFVHNLFLRISPPVFFHFSKLRADNGGDANIFFSYMVRSLFGSSFGDHVRKKNSRWRSRNFWNQNFCLFTK